MHTGDLIPGAHVVLEPHWKTRPWPPKDTYAPSASDEGLGLVEA